MLPLRLHANGLQQMAAALVDSGADVNVLPWSIGASLGFVWEPNKATIRVAGIAQGAAMPVLLSADFGDVQGATMAFAWCQTDSVPLVLGQTNFFISSNDRNSLLPRFRSSRARYRRGAR
jgi:hypothetical protein